MKDQNNTSGHNSIDEGNMDASNESSQCSGSEGRPSLASAKATDRERLSRQADSGRQADGVDAALSAEEYRMAELIVAGYTDADLASLFSLTEATIHDRTARIFAKLGVSNKLELVLFAISYRVFV